MKKEQLGNQTSLLNNSSTTFALVAFGVLLATFHWVCVWLFMPGFQMRYAQACMRPNGDYGDGYGPNNPITGNCSVVLYCRILHTQLFIIYKSPINEL